MTGLEMKNKNVGLDVIVVPDGRTRDKLKLSLVLSFNSRENDINLLDWPLQHEEILDKLQLIIAKYDNTKKEIVSGSRLVIKNATVISPLVSNNGEDELVTHANQLFKKIFFWEDVPAKKTEIGGAISSSRSEDQVSYFINALHECEKIALVEQEKQQSVIVSNVAKRASFLQQLFQQYTEVCEKCASKSGMNPLYDSVAEKPSIEFWSRLSEFFDRQFDLLAQQKQTGEDFQQFVLNCEALIAEKVSIHRESIFDVDNKYALSDTLIEEIQEAFFEYMLDEWVDQQSIDQLTKKETHEITSSPISEASKVIMYKIAGIMNYPNLAKFLGLIIDVEISLPEGLSENSDNENWMVAADLSGTISDYERIFTSFVLSKDDFYPRPHIENTLGESFLEQNMVNLAEKDSRGKARFSIVTIDSRDGLKNIIVESKRISQLGTKTDSAIPEITDRGITIIDQTLTSTNNWITRQKLRDEILHDAKKNGELSIKYAEDLLTGLRFLTKAIKFEEGLKKELDWKLLHHRSVEVSDIHSDYKEQLDAFKERDFGQTSLFTPSYLENKKVEVLYGLLMEWMGEGLSLPADRPLTGSGFNPDESLNINLKIGVDNGVLPPLRVGWKYKFAAYPVYINGGSMTLDKVKSRLKKKNGIQEFTIGDENGEFYEFVYSNAIKAPKVLIDSRDEDIGEGKKLMAKVQASTELLIIRDGGNKSACRYLVPDKVPFDIAEQSGAFDNMNEPKGSYYSGKYSMMLDSGGGFPVLSSDGKILLNADPGLKNGKHVRGYVKKEQTLGGAKNREYFPDPRVKGIKVEVIRAGDYKQNDLPNELKSVIPEKLQEGKFSFHKESYHVESAGWVKLILETASEKINKFNFDDDGKEIKIQLQQAEQLILKVFCTPFLDYKNKLVNINGLTELMNETGVNHLQRFTDIRLVHAVREPLKTPEISSFNTSVIRYKDEKSWYYKDEGKLQKSEKGGDRVFFVGEINLDRRSSSSVRIYFSWEEFQGIVEDSEEKYKEDWQRVTGFIDVDNITTHSNFLDENLSSEYPDKSVSIAKSDSGGLRSLSYSFIDNKARKLSVSAEAHSRFKDYFEPSTNNAKEFVTDHSKDVEEWVVSTSRPNQIAFVDSIEVENMFYSQQVNSLVDASDAKNGEQFICKEASVYRVWLDDWYSSGKGEKLAILFWGDSVNKSSDSWSDISEATIDNLNKKFENSMGKPTDLVTRWAADPISFSGNLDDLIPIERFDDWVAVKNNLKLPETNFEAPITALIYEVKFSSKCGRWYCDIGFNPAASHQHWLHLSLARYQEHSVEGLELSEPKAHKIWWPGSFDLSVNRTDDSLNVSLSSVGYRFKKSDGNIESTKQDVLNMPILKLTGLCRSIDDESNWAPVIVNGSELVYELTPNDYRNDCDKWSIVFKRVDSKDSFEKFVFGQSLPSYTETAIKLEVIDYYQSFKTNALKGITRYSTIVKVGVNVDPGDEASE